MALLTSGMLTNEVFQARTFIISIPALPPVVYFVQYMCCVTLQIVRNEVLCELLSSAPLVAYSG